MKGNEREKIGEERRRVGVDTNISVLKTKRTSSTRPFSTGVRP